MTDRIIRQSKAFKDALDYCKIFNLDWRHHILPRIERFEGVREVTGYYILDRTREAVMKVVDI